MEYLIGISIGFGITAISIFIGAYIGHLSRKQPGEPFVGAPKGEVFRLTDEADTTDVFNPEPSDAEKHVLERSKQFLKRMVG